MRAGGRRIASLTTRGRKFLVHDRRRSNDILRRNFMKLTRNAIFFGLAVGVATAAGCSSEAPRSPGSSDPSASDHGAMGTVGLALDLAPGISLNSVQYTITN